MLNQMKSNDFLLKVAYLIDFFSEVISLNLTLRRGCQSLHTIHDKVAAFKRKVELFLLLQSDPNMKCNFTQDISSHLNSGDSSTQKVGGALWGQDRLRWGN